MEISRETSQKLEFIDGEISFYVKPLRVGAGTYPKLIGDVFRPQVDQFPGLLNLNDQEALKIARNLESLEHLDDDSRHVSSFLPGLWEPLEGVPMAYFTTDLVNAGYSGKNHDAMEGLLTLFRVVLSTPNYVTSFPEILHLKIDFQKGEHVESISVELFSDYSDGAYRIKNVSEVIFDINDISERFGPRKGFTDLGTNIHLSSLSGFDPRSAIHDLPPIQGTMLIHHIYIGSYRVMSGWQWAGRPSGLYGSQQPGFVQ